MAKHEDMRMSDEVLGYLADGDIRQRTETVLLARDLRHARRLLRAAGAYIDGGYMAGEMIVAIETYLADCEERGSKPQGLKDYG